MKRFQPALVVMGALILLSFATRVALVLRTDVPALPLGTLANAFARGTMFDLVTAAYFAAPLALWLALAPDGLARTRAYRAATLVLVGAALFALLVLGVAEWIFWDEFAGRFNFIAVDYLLYTHEVLGNIWQSYPVARVLAGLAAAAALATAILGRGIWHASGAALGWRAAAAALAVHASFVAATLQVVDSDLRAFSRQDAANDLAGNGLYEFFAANRRNELSYDRYYATLPLGEAQATWRHAFGAARWVDPGADGIERREGAGRREKRLDVVLVSVESLGAEFIGAYGGAKGLTPNLDRLARESLVFDRVYATGNRTVRGLEALSLALPPTPGQSIVRRPGNGLLFSLGSVFEDKGYGVLFAYGGYGYFDNMNAFFDANDYRSLDRRSIAGARIEHETVWGVADEHLFDRVLEEIDAEKAAHPDRPLFAHVMTTSNHRPYTYPAGRIDIPSGSGRDGAVKYTDYAIGRFIEAARRRPWFKDTLFVITADHGANARGTTTIPVELYRIPLIVYAPAHVAPRRFARLASQIDIAPTVLGLLDFDYYSKFFGRDVLRAAPGTDRAFVGNYQTLGYLKDDRLVVLMPHRKVEVYALSGGRVHPARGDTAALRREAIAFYQLSSHVFKAGLYSDEEQVPPPRRVALVPPASKGTLYR